MKKLLILFSVFCICTPLAAETSVEQPLRNKVRILDADANFKVRIVDEKAYVNIHPIHGDPRLEALIARAGASRLTKVSDVTPMGFQEWEFVDQGEEFTIQFVDKDEHFTVKFVFDTTGALSEWQAEREAGREARYAAYSEEVYAASVAARAQQEAAERAARSSYSSSSSSSSSSSYSSSSSSSRIVDCKCKGIPLYGKVRVVTIAADFKVGVVTIAPDLRVEAVTIAPNSCGKWEFVEIGEDFTVEFVSIGADFTIEYVTIAPGVR